MKRTCATIEKIIGSKKSSGTFFPKWLVVNDLKFFDKNTIGENFNKFFMVKLDLNLNLKYHIR